jgi:uncharacterized membrane protein YphA (DoxX/SURF4 family)
MTTTSATTKNRALDVIAVLVRWGLGALFIYMGLKKALHSVEFLKLTRQYDLVHSSFFLNSIAATLPWFETFCGLLLVAGIAVRGVALTLVAELIPFTALVWKRALALQVLRGLPFCAIKFDCGCGAGEVYICHKLAENFFLIAASIWLLTGVGRLFCARYSLFQTTSPSSE